MGYRFHVFFLLNPLLQLRMHVLKTREAAIVLPTVIALPAEMTQDTPFMNVPVAALADGHRYPS